MKAILVFTLAIATIFSANAQKDKSQRKSPPAVAEQTVGDLKIKIDYSQPSVKGREVYGKLVKYDKVWRAGANEATTFMVSRDSKVNGKMLPAGIYALFVIPRAEDNWTILFNKEADQWGAYGHKKEQDALTIDVKATSIEPMVETLNFSIAKEGMVTLSWANRAVSFKVE